MTASLVPYGGDDASVATYNGQIVAGQPYTVWYNSTGTSQVTSALLNSIQVAVGTPYYVYSNAYGQLSFYTNDGSQPVWVMAVGDPNRQLVEMQPSNMAARIVAIENGSAGVIIDTNAGDIQPLGTSAAAGAKGQAADAEHVHAGANIVDGVTVSGAAVTGKVITATSTTTANWQTPPSGITIDTTSTDINADGIQAAGSIGKAADSGHVHPLNTSSAIAFASAITTSETLINKLPILPANLAAGSAFRFHMWLAITGTASAQTFTLNLRAGTNGTTADTSLGTLVFTTSAAISGTLNTVVDGIVVVQTAGASGTANAMFQLLENVTDFNSGLLYLVSNAALTSWNTTTSTFLDITGITSTSSLTIKPIQAVIEQVH